MSANRPAEAGKYLSRLMPRGGATGPHADGWGVAYYEGRAFTENRAYKMILLATAPLTAEPWRALAPRSMHVYRQGEEILGEGHAPLSEHRPSPDAALLEAAA